MVLCIQQYFLNNTSVLSENIVFLYIPVMPYESHLNTYQHCLHLFSVNLICNYNMDPYWNKTMMLSDVNGVHLSHSR
jgi:hypothetical protein